jgi:predicted porin
VPLGQGEIRASFGVSEQEIGAARPEARQYAVGYVYNLSKRTALYATGSVIDNKDGAAFSIPTGSSGPALPITASGKSMGIEGGLRHSF